MNIPILLYHSISDQATSPYQPWAIPPREFEMHVAYLRNQGFQPMTVDAIVQAIRSNGANLPERPIALTFDDGLADFLSGAMPILRKYHFPATLYVTTGYVGRSSSWLAAEGEQDRPMLSWDEIASLKDIHLGAHSHTHSQLDILPFSDAREDIVLSKKILEQKLGVSISTFAFPHGYHSHRLKELIKEVGFTSACIVGHAMATDASDVYALPRIIITSNVTVSMLEQYLRGVGLRREGAWRTFLKITWRMVRRIKMSMARPVNHFA